MGWHDGTTANALLHAASNAASRTATALQASPEQRAALERILEGESCQLPWQHLLILLLLTAGGLWKPWHDMQAAALLMLCGAADVCHKPAVWNMQQEHIHA